MEFSQKLNPNQESKTQGYGFPMICRHYANKEICAEPNKGPKIHIGQSCSGDIQL